MTTRPASPPSLSRIESRCVEKGLKMTGQRRAIATVYRTVRLFEEADILEKHDFRDGRARYEEATDHHHDHLIDIQSGQVIEFENAEIEELQRRIAEKLGYRLVDHRLELYAVPAGADGQRKRHK
jgi:Fur family ferric uptake transcriptional regulator